ncbi:hypothetical protein PC119_g18863 [Phytophthora cactorum]|nr:hypothetical protein PC119_g18863 [Phytophthora cactorum]
MKPFRLRSLGVAAFFLAAADTTQVAAIDLEATVVYTASGDCGASTGTPVLVTAVPPSSSCATSVLCTETPASSSLFPATVCSTTDGTANGAFINTKLPAIFGSSPYVVVEAYTIGQTCSAATDITTITAYLADGKCHKTDTAKSYRTTRSADNSAVIKTYTDAVCATGEVVTTVIAADGTAHSCVSNTKVYGAGATPLYLTSTVNYDTSANTCKSGLPSFMATTVVAVDLYTDVQG